MFPHHDLMHTLAQGEEDGVEYGYMRRDTLKQIQIGSWAGRCACEIFLDISLSLCALLRTAEGFLGPLWISFDCFASLLTLILEIPSKLLLRSPRINWLRCRGEVLKRRRSSCVEEKYSKEEGAPVQRRSTQKKKELDKIILNLIKTCIVEGYDDKVYSYIDNLCFK